MAFCLIQRDLDQGLAGSKSDDLELHALISPGNEKVKGVRRAVAARVKNSAAISIGAAKEKGVTPFCGAAAEHKRSDRDGETGEKLREEHCTRARRRLLRASIPFRPCRARRLPLIMLPTNSLPSSPEKERPLPGTIIKLRCMIVHGG